jgi:hypothetical protein
MKLHFQMHGDPFHAYEARPGRDDLLKSDSVRDSAVSHLVSLCVRVCADLREAPTWPLRAAEAKMDTCQRFCC